MFIVPNWPAPDNIRAISSVRGGGVSNSPFASLNVGAHVGDNPHDVLSNRHLLEKMAQMPTSPVWLNQTHSNNVLELTQPADEVLDGDGSFTKQVDVVCAAMTADCLPVLLTDEAGQQVAAVHAGWRGLADGIIENAVNKFSGQVMAWLGPAIGPEAFEVGQDVYNEFVGRYSEAALAFKPHPTEQSKYFANMHLLATQALHRVGVEQVYKDPSCTYKESEQFFSYRRDGKTGRQVTCIWITNAE
ncbi:peptidoglycan editing factor PgeF [Vibrio sp. FNV 38]|nr:peptidoglycan editing factor PgeF [Vibrio sp. FNV 38]